MQKRLILSSELLEITLSRLCRQLIENHNDFESTVLLGMQPRGIFPAEMLCDKLSHTLKKEIPFGQLDSTFHRDDFRRKEAPINANSTHVPFLIENKNVILIDDVLYTGRSVRAALDAMMAFGRPKSVELLVLIDRKYSRELPVEAKYVGKHVDSVRSQRILAEWKKTGAESNQIWLITDQK